MSNARTPWSSTFRTRQAIATGAKFLVLSYMRGRIPDVDKVMALCERLGLYLIEDAAHAYGCEWKGRMFGTFGRSSTISTQANKIMNSGEGGFLCTDDDHIMAKAIISVGCYEELFLQHCDLRPPTELMMEYRMTRVNYSIRMPNLMGAVLLPQVAQIDVRREKHNAIYEKLAKKLEEHKRIVVPPQLPEVSPVHDSIQFTIAGLKVRAGARAAEAGRTIRPKFLEETELNKALPQTHKTIECTLDTR